MRPAADPGHWGRLQNQWRVMAVIRTGAVCNALAAVPAHATMTMTRDAKWQLIFFNWRHHLRRLLDAGHPAQWRATGDEFRNGLRPSRWTRRPAITLLDSVHRSNRR